MASDILEFQDKVKIPLENLRVKKEYLKTSKSGVQWRVRLWQIAEDTATINFASELEGDVGSFGASAASNKIADEYMNEMVNKEVTKTESEKLNLEIFK